MFDPSKMDPKLVAELSQLVQQLPHDQIMRMQTLMHNMMAGMDVAREMQEFEQNLPGDFRAKMARIMMTNPIPMPTTTPAAAAAAITPTNDVDSARLTVLQAVSNGTITPEHALGILFPKS